MLYKSKIYNIFLKEIREEKNLTTKQLSQLCGISAGSINSLENSKSILTNNKTEIVLQTHHLPINYLSDIDDILENKCREFIESVIYDNGLSQTILTDISNFCESYKNTVLYAICDICQFIYNVYHIIDFDQIDIQKIENLKKYLTDDYLTMTNLYIGLYYKTMKDYKNAKKYYDLAHHTMPDNNSLKGMYHYCMATYYVHAKDPVASIQHCDMATNLFALSHNIRRLMNTNIIRTLQHIQIRDYEHALKICKDSLKGNPDEIEKRVLLNNAAFIYGIQEKFEKVCDCYEKMPQQQMRDKHYLGYMIALFELKKYKKAKEMCNIGYSMANVPYYTEIFEAFNVYFEDKDELNLANQLEKIVKKYENILNDQELEEYYAVIYRINKNNGQYKNATEIADQMRQLLIK